MRIFLSHQSRNKPLVREFKKSLPPFLNTWIDEEELSWGDDLQKQLRATIQSGVDFVVIFLETSTLESAWVRQELAWALAREKEQSRTFLLPILLPETNVDAMPTEISSRLFLRIQDYRQSTIEGLAAQATEELFRLVLESYVCLQLQTPREDRSLLQIQNELSAGQAKLLGIVIRRCEKSDEISQREIEEATGHERASGELFYRLESLINQGFLTKRRVPTDGSFAYQLSTEFCETLS